jgi:2-polyprenyl-3-methyl-5-hydroxy-6-metoxy-1,4-benzoquinol methylase
MQSNACVLCEGESLPTRPISGHAMLRCRQCGFVFAKNREIPPNLYESAHTPEGQYGGHTHVVQQLQSNNGQGGDWMHHWVINQVRPFGRKRMLDLGCGVGAALQIAQPAGWTILGQDISKNALKIAHDLVGAQTFECEITELAKANETFDLVTAFNLIEHLARPMEYLRTVRQLMAPGGIFGVAVPNYDSYNMRNATWDQWLPPFHINFFTLRTLTSALRAAGFEMTQHRIRVLSISGFPGTRLKQILLAPYLLANAAIGRLSGNGIVCVAKAI